MAILLKTASFRVSSIQIMQVRVQNKGKSVWKSRYDGDVSLDKHAAKEYYIGQIFKNIEENMVLRMKGREEAIVLLAMDP